MRPGPPLLRDLLNDKTLGLVYKLCHVKEKTGLEKKSIEKDNCEKISTGIGLVAILLIRWHRGYCDLRLSGALHGLWQWIDSEFEIDEVIYSAKEHDDLVECAKDQTNSNDDIIVDIRTNLMQVVPEQDDFRELLTLVLVDLTDSSKRYKKKIARQIRTEIIEYVPPDESDSYFAFSSERPRSSIRRGIGSGISKPVRTLEASTDLFDASVKQQFASLMIKLVESTSDYIIDDLDDHNEQVDGVFSDLFILSAATPLVRFCTIYERNVKLLDQWGFRTLLFKYHNYIEEDFPDDLIVVSSEEIDRHSLNVTHKDIVTETNLWSVVLDFCNLLKKEDLHIFLHAATLLLRILSQFTDDIYGIRAEKMSTVLRQRTKRIGDDIGKDD